MEAYRRAATGRNTDYPGNPEAQLAGWQHSLDTALGNAGGGSPQSALQYLFGNSVTSAMSSAITQKNEHTLITAQTQGQVMQVLPELSTGLTVTVERIFKELAAVVSFNRMGFGFKKITVEKLETRLANWVNGADLTGGVVASYTGRSYTFAVNRYAAAAQIEATALLGPRAPMIFEALLAGLLQSLRLTWAKLAITCMLNNGGRPTFDNGNSDGSAGRLMTDVLSFYNRVACNGSRSSNALALLSSMLAKESEKRGDQDWPYLLVSQSFVRRAAALMTPGPNLVTGDPGGVPVAPSAAISAVSARLGKTLIVLPSIPDGRRMIQLLIRRVNCVEMNRVCAGYFVDQEVKQIPFTGDIESKKRGLKYFIKKHVQTTQVDRPGGYRKAFSLHELIANHTWGYNATIRTDLGNFNNAETERKLIHNNDVVTLAPHTIVGDAMIASGAKSVDLYATQVLADAAVSVETRLLTIEKLTFIGVTLPEIRKVLVLPPFFAEHRICGGKATIISPATLQAANYNFAASNIDHTQGFVSMVVPEMNEDQVLRDDTFGTIDGSLDSTMTGESKTRYLFGTAADSQNMRTAWHLQDNYISFKKNTENQSTHFSVYTCCADSILMRNALGTEGLAPLNAAFEVAGNYTAQELAAIANLLKQRKVYQVKECSSFNGTQVYQGMERDFLASGDNACMQDRNFKFSTHRDQVLDAIQPATAVY